MFCKFCAVKEREIKVRALHKEDIQNHQLPILQPIPSSVPLQCKLTAVHNELSLLVWFTDNRKSKKKAFRSIPKIKQPNQKLGRRLKETFL